MPTRKVATDVKRLPTDYIGDVGELKIALKFVEMGCSVNSLTGSDYGLDLHIQLPERAILAKKQNESWAMSGRTAHLQVKHSTGDNDPSIKIPTLRSWVTGSRTGVPTFLICLYGEHARYAAPWHFVDKLKEAESEEKLKATKSFSKKTTLDLNEATFPHLLQLWTKYPALMLMARVDSWQLYLDFDERFKALVAALCYAWAMDHRLPNDADTTAANRLMELGMLAAPLVDQDANPMGFSEDLLAHIEEGREEIRKSNERQLTEFLAEYDDNYKKAKEHADGSPDTLGFQELASEKMRLINATRNSPWPEPTYRHVYATSTSMLRAQDEVLELIADLADYRTVLMELAPTNDESGEPGSSQGLGT